MADQYLQREESGRKLQQWMENPNEPGCPYPRSTFAITPESSDWLITHESDGLEKVWQVWTVPLGLPTTIERREITNEVGRKLEWEGRTALGMILIDWICRSSQRISPFISEFTKAVYEMDFPIDSLQYLFFADIMENGTLPCIMDIYKSREGLEFPSNEPQSWMPSSPEYHALLGTRIGKIASAVVLGAWGQGKKRIGKIFTFHTGAKISQVNVRFDIEDI
ncbi:hypothetical protein N7457_000929 [Penicillium paradoxum]|uniref:uncharacterized protein n=1 Tax=Penicillium paradoxum TaxID=176176 RepID=UPI002546AAE3|nr:uncharacterized protein N7457_000929 [Penicillium paradoxum]KAJ5794330.1 hypothetical protein N7457_000929 [Penicillium paradoxum]